MSRTKEDCYNEATLKNLSDPNGTRMDIIYAAMDVYAKPYKGIADLVSRIFHYGNFKAETNSERKLEQLLIEVGLWPTTEDEIIKRGEI